MDIKQPCKLCGFESRPGRKTCKYCNCKIRRARLKLAAVQYCGGKCNRCQYDENPWVFEFHHKDNNKEFQISDVSLSWEKTKVELDKCTMLCSNCHRLEHVSLRGSADFMKVILDYQGSLDLGIDNWNNKWVLG